MTDGQIALLVLALFTLYEGTRWLPARAWVFQSPLIRKKWRAKPTWETLRLRGGGLVMLNPLPPPGAHIVTTAWPCVPYENALCIWHDETGSVEYLPWEEVQIRSEDSILHIGPNHRVRCINPTSAQAWGKHLLRWKGQDALTRQNDFEGIANTMLNKKELLKQSKEIIKTTSDLRFQGLVILFATFGMLPYIYWLRGDSVPTYTVLGGLVLMMFIQAFQLWRLTKKHPNLRKDAVSHIFGVALFPPSAIRAADWVCGLISKDVHPLAAHQLWSSREVFLREASLAWRKARWPKGSNQGEWPSEGRDVQALRTFFTKNGIDLSGLEAAPEKALDSTQYCPRCLVTYTPKVQFCADCKCVPLKAFTDSALSL